MATYYKPQSPIQSGEDFIYPITTADQIMKSDNSRLEQNGEIIADNSPKLGGIAASEYALKTKTVPTSRTVNGKVLSENITLAASDVGAIPTNRTVNGKALSSNISLSSSDVGAVPTSRKVNNKALSADISLSAGDVGAVPTSRTVNGKALSSNISLSSSDVGAVPTSRTINGKALSSDISLSSSDVGALASGGTATNSSKLEGNTLAQIMLKAYPVGAIYISTSSTSPAYLFGGTWEQLTDRFLLGAGNAYGAGSAGGESMHTLTRNELPNYKIGDLAVMVPAVHGNWSNGGIIACGLGDASQTKPGIADRSNNIIYSGIQYGWEIDSYGGGSAHNNMPPYLAVYMWKRVS